MSILRMNTERTKAARATVPGTAMSDDHIDLTTVFRILLRQLPVIVLTLMVFVGLATAYATFSPKVWRSSAKILLDPREKQIVGNDVNRQPQGTEVGWVETRLELVKSFDTLAAVVKKENLVDDDEIWGAAATARSSDDPIVGAVRNLAEKVLVERPKENNLIDVTVSSKSPEKAARLANAVAGAFVDGLASAKVEQIEHANELLSRQVDDMRAKMLEAEARVEDYKRNNGIAMTRGNLVEEETLRQSNETLVAARTRTQETRERSERLAQLLKSGDPTVLSQTDAIGSAVISRLKIEAAMAARRKTELEQTLGPRHPRVAAAAAEVERAKSQVGEEVKSLAATAALDHQVARANEENARKAVERAQARLADASQALSGMQELENEANARRELYKNFVGRMQETTLQRNTQVSDARVVSPAQIPLRPFSPRTSLALALAAVAGLGLGLSLALYRGRGMLHPAPVEAPSPEPEAVAAATPEEAVAPVVAASPLVVPPPPVPAETSAVAPPPPEPIAAVPVVDARIVEAPLAEPVAEAAPAPLVAPSTAETVPVETVPTSLRAAMARLSSPPAEADGPNRVAFSLTLDRITRLGRGDGAGFGASALTRTPDGAVDLDGLERLQALSTALTPGAPGLRVVFSNTVPALLTAALADGLARVAAGRTGKAALVDLAHEAGALEGAFEAAEPIELADAADDDDWERARDADGLLLVRPLDPISAGDPDGHPGDVDAVLSALRDEVSSVVVHLGRVPTAALLFDIAEIADHMILVVDEQDLASRRISEEITVMRGLLPRFDGLIVLAREEEPGAVPVPRPKRRQRPVA